MLFPNLVKILRLEAERLDDHAVVGGLGRCAATWTQEATRTLGPQAAPWIEQVAERLRRYARLEGRAARAQAVAELLAMIQTPPTPAAEPATKPPEPRPAPSVRPPGPRAVVGPPVPPGERLGLDAPVTALEGVGRASAERLAHLGLRTIRDMLYFFPRRHDDYSTFKTINRLEYGEKVSVIAKVVWARAHQTRTGAELFRALLSDGSGSIEATWFNQAYLANRIRAGQQLVLSGKVDEYLGRLCLNSPEWEKLDEERLHTGRIVPVYPLTEGIQAKWLRQKMARTVDYWSKRLPDHLPAWIRKEQGLLDLETAIAQAHFPDSVELLQRANRRLAFDELFALQVGLQQLRRRWRSEAGQPLEVSDGAVEAFIASLPYPLTGAQRRALAGIVGDMRSRQPMARLLQGDVGSGKTVVAAAAMAMAAAAGAQAVLMAPTEILAEQHYRTLSGLFERAPGRPLRVALLTGSVDGAEREEVYAGLADGSVDVAVGTHALIQAGVAFRNLALVVIDEQHRFGVRQRAALRQKGYNPHLLVMTATPIPRSLQLAVWGHMDVSVIDELPPGRQRIETRIVTPGLRERAYRFVERQIEQGRQAFIICPLVEESEKIEAKAAVEEHARLQREVFPHLRLGLLHGRMRSDEKEATMARFLCGELDILVSTSVVEVGVDVPNATVMLIEGANRFGLAQLHQFRGRVGRGEHPSYCLLFSDSDSPEGRERLEAIATIHDGFELAQKDLEMRGPGEFLGTRQAGLPELRFARYADVPMIEAAREAACRLLEMDPELTHPDHRLLARQVARLWEGRSAPEIDSGEGDIS